MRLLQVGGRTTSTAFYIGPGVNLDPARQLSKADERNERERLVVGETN